MKRFLKTIALFLVPAVLAVGVFGAALLHSGELAPMEEVRRAALEGRLSRFGFAYRENIRAFKEAVAGARGAEVLVLGTSRSMQLRSEFFGTDSFYNAGGGIAYLSQARHFLERMPEHARPKRLLLVLDQYFYNAKWRVFEPEDSEQPEQDSTADVIVTLRHMIWDYGNGKFLLRQVFGAPDGTYGLMAAARGAGFCDDGSYRYGSELLHPEQSLDAGFANTFERIEQETNRFESGETPDEAAFAETRALLEYCSANGIAVTAFMPPYAPSVWQRMQQTGNYRYIPAAYAALQELFAEYGFEVFDYSSLPETQDDQYVDGFHGSDRVYAAVCARLARDSALMGDLFDAEALTALFRAPGNPLFVTLED